jgi:acetyl esterase/lipase
VRDVVLHPAQVDDAIAVYRGLLERGIAVGHIAFTDDSSGGWLVIATQLRARGLELPSAGSGDALFALS